MAETIENWTGNTLKIKNIAGDIITIPTDGPAPTVKISHAYLGEIGGFQITKTVYAAVNGLPKPRDGVLLIVPASILEACYFRGDLAAPGEALSLPYAGAIGFTACRGLENNLQLFR